MKRNLIVSVLSGFFGSAVLLILLSIAGSVGAHSVEVRSDVARANEVSAAPTVTNVCGNIPTNTTWSLINSPYDVCIGGASIGPTATLTIQPGVTVQFDNSGSNQLNVNYGATLIAIGTLTQPITFTGVVATPGSWGGISAFSTFTPSLIHLSYVTLEYGGVNGSTGAQLYTYAANVITVTHSLIRNGAGAGVYGGYLSQVDIHDTSFISNARNAIQLDQPNNRDILMSGLSASGNGVDAVYIAGSTTMNGQRRWAFTGIPYVINAPVFNGAGDVLSIDPGSELQFTTTNATLLIHGEFKAIGLPNAPITLTGQIKTPGTWTGLQVSGAVVDQAIAQLDYTTVEYGGSASGGANIDVGFGGQLVARHSLIRYSSKDGVRNDGSNASLSVLNSQIFSNTLYGVRNQWPALAILATNNWWGNSSGPTSDTPACSPGTGGKVTDGVLFRPVLTSTNLSADFPLSDAPILTLTPRRWFAPADGTTKVYFDITLRDANGAPLPRRTVNLYSSIGTPTSGGSTDLNGKALAYLVSNSVGDANVTALLSATACESAMSPKAKVTFTTPLNITDLFPNSPASYFDGNISVSPQPVYVGITATIQAKLTNPLTVPITVDVSFAYVQSSIGLAFGPIGDITATIPASSTITLAATFVPIVSGHYCVQVSYNITAIGSQQLLRPQVGGSGSQQLNLNAFPGPMGTPSGKDALNKADKSFKLVSKLTPKPLKIQKAIIGRWWDWAKDSASKISQALGFDPPRQDYNQPTLPVWHTWPPVQPITSSVSITRANALNAASAALADVNAYGTAATVALDRYAGASEAHDLTWAAEQANARLFYQQKMGDALLVYASNLDDFVQVLVDEGETNITITASDMISYQQRLIATGFTAQEIDDAHLVGLTDADIEEFRLGIIAANPNDIAGNLLDIYTNEAAISRELGRALIATRPYEPSFHVGGSAGLKPSSAMSNTLAQINTMVSTLQLGNPLTQTALIDVRARRIDLPADWMVNVSPAQVTLTPSETITVTVSVIPGSLIPQGSIPRVAVEGYVDISNQLLGGVAIDIVVPNYVDFAPYHVYLPLIRK